LRVNLGRRRVMVSFKKSETSSVNLVWGAGLRIQGLGFRVQGSGFRVQGSGSGGEGGTRG